MEGTEIRLRGVLTPSPTLAAAGVPSAAGGATRFAFAITGFLLLLSVFYARPELHRVLDPVELWTARTVAGLVETVGLEVARSGTVLRHPAGFAYEIYHRCTGVPVIALLATGLLALPSRRRRLTGLALGTILVLVVNLVRLVSLFAVGVLWPAAFDLVHGVLWEGVMILLVVGFWLLWPGAGAVAAAQ